jgi:predicted  nucleic acid-binding Zn ribbon protein
MTDFLKNCLHFERVDVFKLGGNKHACDSYNMQVANFLRSLSELEVSIHKTDRNEKSLVVALEITKNFYHPVHHSRSHVW